MSKVKDYEQCGLPVRRASGSEPCVLQAGHRETWCQDERAMANRTAVARMPEVAQEARAVLCTLGCALLGIEGSGLGRAETEQWIVRYLGEGGTLPR